MPPEAIATRPEPPKRATVDDILAIVEKNAAAKKGEQQALPEPTPIEKEETEAKEWEVEEMSTPVRARKTILIIGLAVFLLMGLFPPWEEYGRGSAKWPKGYSFIFMLSNVGSEMPYGLDVSRLAVQWILVAGGTAGFMLLFDKKKHRTSEDDKETPPRTG